MISIHFHLKKNQYLWILGISTLLISVSYITFAFLFSYAQKNVLTSPLGNASKILGFRQNLEKPDKIVYGYLPYWNFKYADTIRLDSLTHLSLFGLSYTSDGSIQTREENYMEPGWRNLNSEAAEDFIIRAKNTNTKVTVSMIAFDNEIIESIISSQSATERLIQETLSYVQKYSLDGINIDFEYIGSPSIKIQKQFTQFVQTTTDEFKASNPEYHVSVAVYADSADNNRIWEVDKIGQIVDHIMIMAYDFHRPSSTQAGPVAPLYGGNEKWDMDITNLLAKHLELNAAEKLILGVPFYGYEWQTISEDYQARTLPRSGRMASYKRIKEIIAEKDPIIQWDTKALSPWFVHDEDDAIYQIYYDDTRSFALKYDLVIQSGLAGIGIWALGYEGDNSEVWKLINDKF